MIYDGILFTNSVYKVFVKTQDSTEKCGEFLTEDEAVKSYKRSHKILNGNEDKIPSFYAEKLEVVSTLVKYK